MGGLSERATYPGLSHCRRLFRSSETTGEFMAERPDSASPPPCRRPGRGRGLYQPNIPYHGHSVAAVSYRLASGRHLLDAANLATKLWARALPAKQLVWQDRVYVQCVSARLHLCRGYFVPYRAFVPHMHSKMRISITELKQAWHRI